MSLRFLCAPTPPGRPRAVIRGAAFAAALAVALGFARAGHAQEQGPPPGVDAPRRQAATRTDPGQDDVLRIDTDLVTVDAVVTDAAGRPVRNLRPNDFKLYEDGEALPVSFFSVEQRAGVERPVAVVFALDTSGSVTPAELARLRTALEAFTDQISKHPMVFSVMTFGMRVKTLLPFTSNPRRMEVAFDRLEHEPNGLSTHAYDAVDDAIRMLVRKAPRTRERRLVKRAVVVITDGFPVGDTISPRTVIQRANDAEVSVYTVTLPSYSRVFVSTNRQPLPTPLDVSGLVDETGGKNVYATERDFAPLFRALAEEVTSAYVLAFYPPDDKRHDGKFHSLRVEVPAGLTIRQSRPGFQGNAGKSGGAP